MTYKDSPEKLKNLVHKLNHNLTLVYGYIDVSVQNLKDETMKKDDIIRFLTEAQGTYNEVKEIIDEIINQINRHNFTE